MTLPAERWVKYSWFTAINYLWITMRNTNRCLSSPCEELHLINLSNSSQSKRQRILLIDSLSPKMKKQSLKHHFHLLLIHKLLSEGWPVVYNLQPNEEMDQPDTRITSHSDKWLIQSMKSQKQCMLIIPYNSTTARTNQLQTTYRFICQGCFNTRDKRENMIGFS